MNCPACAEPMDVSTDLPGSQVLCACGLMVSVPASPGPSARAGGAGASLACPRCAAALVKVATVGDIGAHACPECGGVFADRAGVAALSSGADAPTHPARRVDTSGYIKCPVCGDPMTRLNYGRRSGVMVDLCIDHGTWFDADELDRVNAFLASGGLSRPGAPPPEPASLPPEGRYLLGELQAQVIGEREDALERAERARYRRWYDRGYLGLVIDLLR
jgi:Zn-finger nucleic acid-binding protein